uniref:Uncharacterized protein n=1 Tax=Megaselia scalaris TaxID=36166 RepID=T1H484_MEGSC
MGFDKATHCHELIQYPPGNYHESIQLTDFQHNQREQIQPDIGICGQHRANFIFLHSVCILSAFHISSSGGGKPAALKSSAGMRSEPALLLFLRL